MINVVMLSVVILNVASSLFMLSVVMLNVVKLSVVEPVLIKLKVMFFYLVQSFSGWRTRFQRQFQYRSDAGYPE